MALGSSAKTQCFGNDDKGVTALVGQLVALGERLAVVLLEATGGLEQRRWRCAPLVLR